MEAIKNKINLIAVCLVVGLLIPASGCIRMAVEKQEPFPGIIWPKPPDIPRIAFVRSLSKPEELGIAEGAIKRFFRFLAGTVETPLIHPHGVEIDAEGRVYVVDTTSKKIHVYDGKGKKYTVFPEKDTTLVSPIDLAIDNKRGRIYVADSADAAVKIYKKKGAEFIGEIRRDALGRPSGVAVNTITDELLVVDAKKSGVLRFALEDHRSLGMIGEKGDGRGTFNSPTHIFVSGNGAIFITDALNFRVQVFTPEGTFIRAFGSPGDGPGRFSRPKGVAADSDGNIYVVDALFDNVQMFDQEGLLLMSFGGPGHGYGEFWLPSGICIDADDRIYVSDSFNNRVQIFQYMKGGELPE